MSVFSEFIQHFENQNWVACVNLYSFFNGFACIGLGIIYFILILATTGAFDLIALIMFPSSYIFFGLLLISSRIQVKFVVSLMTEWFGFFSSYKGKGVFNIFLGVFIVVPFFYVGWIDVIVNIMGTLTLALGVFYIIYGWKHDAQSGKIEELREPVHPMESNPSGGSTEEAPNDSIVNPESTPQGMENVELA